jgi:hypothetical protein
MRVNRDRSPTFTLAVLSGDQADVPLEAFVAAMLAMGPAVERRSRYGNKLTWFLNLGCAGIASRSLC